MQIKLLWSFTFPRQNRSSEGNSINRCKEDERKDNTYTVLVGKQACSVTLETSMEVSQNTEPRHHRTELYDSRQHTI